LADRRDNGYREPAAQAPPDDCMHPRRLRTIAKGCEAAQAVGLQVLELVEIGVQAELLSDARGGLAELADALAQRTAHLGQPARTEDDQRDDQDDDDLLPTDVAHVADLLGGITELSQRWFRTSILGSASREVNRGGRLPADGRRGSRWVFVQTCRQALDRPSSRQRCSCKGPCFVEWTCWRSQLARLHSPLL